MKKILIQILSMCVLVFSVSACTTNQMGTTTGGAAGAGAGYALTGSGWGAAIGGGAGALIGHELSEKSKSQ